MTIGKKGKAAEPAKDKPEGKPKVDPVFGDLLPAKKEDSGGEKKEKRAYRKREKTVPLFEDKFFSLIWEKIFIRIFPEKPLSGDESAGLGSSTNVVISKHIPDLLAKYSDELMLGFNVSLAVMVRMTKKEAKEKESISGVSAGDAVAL